MVSVHEFAVPLILFKQIIAVLSNDSISVHCASCAKCLILSQDTLTLRVAKSVSLHWVWYVYWGSKARYFYWALGTNFIGR
jgi:hypothetical protein